MSMVKPRAWITGASSGIGKMLALELYRGGYDVIVSGRNLDALHDLAKTIPVDIVSFDVTDRAEVLSAASHIKAKFGAIDVLVLNAGNCIYVDVLHFDAQIFVDMMNTNFLSMVYGVEAALPLLRLSKNPQIVGMSSAVAFMGLPRSEAYGASKAAIRNFLQGLRVSLLPEKIAVSIVYPGFVKTPLTDKNDFPMPGLISAEVAAKKIARGILRKKANIYVPVFFVAVVRFLSVLPTAWSLFFLRRLLRRS